MRTTIRFNDSQPVMTVTGGDFDINIDSAKVTMFCPICGGKLIPERIECSDKSGWMFGWGCDCTAERRDEHPELAEVIVYAG